MFSLATERAHVFAEPGSPVDLIGAFDTAAAMVENQLQAAFKNGRGLPGATKLAACSAPSRGCSALVTSMPSSWSGCRGSMV
ncbi:hypothetical protein [Rhizobium sp. 10PS4]|uniref:hypothetical protein n=1 Tax=Rhizobium sp. 10PS4 TaxID=3075621 RepID=UPI003F885DA5